MAGVLCSQCCAVDNRTPLFLASRWLQPCRSRRQACADWATQTMQAPNLRADKPLPAPSQGVDAQAAPALYSNHICLHGICRVLPASRVTPQRTSFPVI